jgi:hypothetical protein
MQGSRLVLEGGADAGFLQYNDPRIVQLGDFVNARAKLRHGALSHIITARILDSYTSSDQIQDLVDNPKFLDKLFEQIANEVLPGSTKPVGPAAVVSNPVDSIEEEVKLPTLPRNNSWGDLLLFQRA